MNGPKFAIFIPTISEVVRSSESHCSDLRTWRLISTSLSAPVVCYVGGYR